MENLLLLAAACLSCCAGTASFFLKNKKHTYTILRWIWGAAAGCILIALGLMARYLLAGRFDIAYVYSHTDRGLETAYRISALWAGQEGSFLLFAAAYTIMGMPLLKFKTDTAMRAFGIYALTGFCLFIMCFISNPFLRMEVTPENGLGLAEALKDPWMVVHPPLVFIAYSAMAVLASLSAGLDKQSPGPETDRMRFWTLFSWIFLGLGIFTGSVWAYRALGWGGYWAWDPIENAALVPWLILCGYIHGKTGEKKFGRVLPFIAACFGTFLTRSGILKDVSSHAYTEGNQAVSALIIALIMVFVCCIIYMKVKARKDPAAHEVKTDRTSALFYLFAALIFLGTVAPLVLKINTSGVFYTVISILFALVFTAFLLYRDLNTLIRNNIWVMAINTALSACVVLLIRRVNILWILLFWFCVSPLSLWITDGFKSRDAKYYVYHIGMILLIAGAITSSALSYEAFALVRPGSAAVNIGGVSLEFSRLLGRDTVILSSVLQDAVIASAGSVVMPEGTLAIPYTVKPLISLFWTGGFSAILSPCLAAAANKISHAIKQCRGNIAREQARAGL
jgi:cytochrome c-type biogenesis protein CcmF